MLAYTAHAAPVDAITNVATSPATIDPHADVMTDITWSVPNGSHSGDTFTITIPSRLTPPPSGVEMRNGNGDVVAITTTSGSTITFTLTNFVDTHSNVHGDFYFSSGIDSATDGETVPLVYQTMSQTFNRSVTIEANGVDRSEPVKGGWWSNADEGTQDPNDALGWLINMPSGEWTDMTIVDTLAPGQTLDCSFGISFSVNALAPNGFDTGNELYYIIANAGTGWTATLPDGSVLTVTSCTASGFTATINSHTGTSDMQVVGYRATVVDTNADSYDNSATMTWTTPDGPTQHSSTLSASVQRTLGGSGDGDDTPNDPSDPGSTTATNPDDTPVPGAPDTGVGRGVNVSVMLIIGGGAGLVIAGAGVFYYRRKHATITLGRR